MRRITGKKPMSSMRSASSSTTRFTLAELHQPTVEEIDQPAGSRDQIRGRRPGSAGVGFVHSVRRQQQPRGSCVFDASLANVSWIWIASSRVGLKMTACNAGPLRRLAATSLKAEVQTPVSYPCRFVRSRSDRGPPAQEESPGLAQASAAQSRDRRGCSSNTKTAVVQKIDSFSFYREG